MLLYHVLSTSISQLGTQNIMNDILLELYNNITNVFCEFANCYTMFCLLVYYSWALRMQYNTYYWVFRMLYLLHCTICEIQ